MSSIAVAAFIRHPAAGTGAVAGLAATRGVGAEAGDHQRSCRAAERVCERKEWEEVLGDFEDVA